jgi:hypothetical protein
MLNADTNRVAPRKVDTMDFWDEAGTSHLLFNATGNVALKFSQIKDSAIVFKLLESYSTFLNKRLKRLWNMKQVDYHFKFLDITLYNQGEMIDFYRNQATLGYSKLLLLIAQGINQAEIPSLLDLELHQLKIGDLLVPLMTSYTIPGGQAGQASTAGSAGDGGRPASAQEDLADETIDNQQDAT